MSALRTTKISIGWTIVAVVAALFVVLGIMWIVLTIVADVEERRLYRIGKVVEAEVVTEEIYTARTYENMVNFDGLSDLRVVRDWTTTPSTWRTRYRYQLYVDGFKFTVRNRPGTRRFRTGTSVLILYNPEDVTEYRLYMGEPQTNTGYLLGGIAILAAGTVAIILLKRKNLW